MIELNVPNVGRGLRLLFRDPRQFYRRARRIFGPMRKDYRQRLSISLRDWILYHHRTIHFEKSCWLGVRALKNPLDAWIYQEIICDVEPDVIVEIGSMEGGSTLYLASILELLGKGLVISVDIDRTHYHAKHPRIIEVTGSSSSPEVISEVTRRCDGKTVMVIQDADHNKEGVLKDLRNYSGLVSVNSYFIVEDGVIDLYNPRDVIGGLDDGPLAAIDLFLSENSAFEVDMERERYLITYNPRGFLRRIR